MTIRDQTVVVFGAGATKACGGPLTNDILPRALDGLVDREDSLARINEFLAANFSGVGFASRADSFPPLPLLIGLVDSARIQAQVPGRAFSGAAQGDWPRVKGWA